MGKLNEHWTAASVEDFLHRIASDFVSQIEQMMDATGISQAQLAKVLGVSEGRVSQVLNNPGNLTLRKIIEYARALKKKVAIVAYDDDDPQNHNGPVSSGVFAACWQQAGKPTDFFEVAEAGNFVIRVEPYPCTGINNGNKHDTLEHTETDSTMATQQTGIFYAGSEANCV